MIDSEKNPYKSIIRAIKDKKFNSINCKKPEVFNQLVSYLESLQLQAQNLRMIKLVMVGFGAPIIIKFKKFYESMSQPFIQKYENQIKKLATVAKAFLNGENIIQLNFLYVKGVNQEKINVNLKKSQKWFIQQIVKLNELVLQCRNSQKSNKILQEFYQQKIEKYKDNYFYQQCFIYYFQQAKNIYLTSQNQSRIQQDQSFFQYPQQKLKQKTNAEDLTTESNTTCNQAEQKTQQFAKKKENIQTITPLTNNQASLSNSSISLALSEKNTQSNISEPSYWSMSNLDLGLPQIKQEEYFDQSRSEQKQQKTILNQTIRSTNQDSESIQTNYDQNILEDVKMSKVIHTYLLCCKRFFTQQQILIETQNMRTAFVNLDYPFKQSQILQIKDLLCAFLNTQGGIIYMGVQTTREKARIIKGAYYSQAKKQNVLRSFRQMAQCLEPDIITHKMYNVVFVPVKERLGDYLPGKFVVKIYVRCGVRDDVYSYYDGKKDRFVFRNDAQLYEVQGRKLLDILKNKIQNPSPKPVPQHEGPCLPPEIGHQMHVQQQQIITTINLRRVQNKIKPTYFKNNNMNINFSTRNTKDQLIPLQAPMFEPGYVAAPHQSTTAAKQHTLCYFIVVGVNEVQQLTSIFQKKNLLGQVQLIQSQLKLIVVKIKTLEAVKKVIRIFQKLDKKYQYFSFHKLSFQVKVKQMRKALQILKIKRKNQYTLIQPDIIRFKYYRDSVAAYLYFKEANIEMEFV